MIKKALLKIKTLLFSPIYTRLTILTDSSLDQRFDEVKKNIEQQTPGNIVKYGAKCYSAGEEDGIITEIFNRIKAGEKIFVEIGCGYGIENNSHFMLLNKWRGTWIDGSKRFIDSITVYLGSDKFNELLVKNYFVTNDNVKTIFAETLEHFKANEVDFFSLDIDGNDYFLMQTILDNQITPKVICVEYNGKYPYPCEVKVSYQADFVWSGDDYMGVSLGSWVELFTRFNYSLICCDATGNNAFFVRNEYAHLFPQYTPSQLFQPARYYLVRRRIGHSPSMKFLKNTLTQQ